MRMRFTASFPPASADALITDRVMIIPWQGGSDMKRCLALLLAVLLLLSGCGNDPEPTQPEAEVPADPTKPEQEADPTKPTEVNDPTKPTETIAPTQATTSTETTAPAKA
jgi:outer membrane biosynthesis protein TonB